MSLFIFFFALIFLLLFLFASFSPFFLVFILLFYLAPYSINRNQFTTFMFVMFQMLAIEIFSSANQNSSDICIVLKKIPRREPFIRTNIGRISFERTFAYSHLLLCIISAAIRLNKEAFDTVYMDLMNQYVVDIF